MTITEWMLLLCGLTILAAVSGVVINRLVLGRGYGVRAVQFVGAATVVPGIVVMALTNKLDGTAAALFGAFIGYLFFNIYKFDERGPARPK